MVPQDVIGCCYDWGLDGVDVFGTPEVEGCVVPWEVNGCLVAGGISHDASVDAKVCVLVALFVAPLSNSVVGVSGETNIGLFMFLEQLGWGVDFRTCGGESQAETVTGVADQLKDHRIFLVECCFLRKLVGFVGALVVQVTDGRIDSRDV